MEKTFQRMTTRPSARHAYVEAEVATALARQVRTIRLQRGWSQAELARRLGTTQAVVSRLEDPSYGRTSLRTLFDLSRVFDTGLQVRFVSMVRMLRETWQPQPDAGRVASFEEEAARVVFIPTSVLSAPHYFQVVVPAAGQHGDAAASTPALTHQPAQGWMTFNPAPPSTTTPQLIKALHA